VRVLHITTEFPPVIYGGLGTAVGGLVRASVETGLQVAVLLIGYGGSPGYSYPRAEASVDKFKRKRRKNGTIWAVPHGDAVAASIEFSKRWQPNVIHVHVFWLAHIAAAVREATGAPLIYTVHSLDRAEYEIGEGPPECLTQWAIQRDLIASADVIVALSNTERTLISQYYPSARDRIRVVGNGIADSWQARRNAQARRARDTITILFTGRFVDRKGIREILMAAPKILSAAPQARLLMVGGHRHSDAEQVSRYWLPPSCAGVHNRIIFTGWLAPDQMTAIYSSADILVVPSWYEPFGMVVLEGMLHGLAIVAANVGGPKEILADEETALFCEPRDAASLEARVLRLIKDSSLRLRLGCNAAREVRSHWLYSKIMGRMSQVYLEATNLRCSVSGIA
jgi:glycosyltransferase involved in cell wall biosynthesis